MILRLVSVFLVLVSAVIARAAQSAYVQVTPGSPLNGCVRLESFMDRCPSTGFIPVRVSVDNPFDTELVYTLDYRPTYRNESAMVGSFKIRAAAGVRSSSIVYVPYLDTRGWSNLEVALTGPQIKSAKLQLNHQSSYGSSSYDHTGMGEAFAATHVGAIESEVMKSGAMHGGTFSVTKIGVAFAPTDRRAYDGFGTLWFSEKEWNAHEPAMRAAVMEWVATGGELYLLGGTAAKKDERVGFGGVHKLGALDAKNLATYAAGEIRGRKSAATLLSENGEPSLYASFKAAAVDRPIALILLLIAFGVVVGPVNLFVFARPPRRHRLLWTTPLIAVVAATLLMGSILLVDGTGGTGRRLAMGVLSPETKRMAVWQQQVSRTGLLMGDAFDFEPTALLSPITPSGGSGSRERRSYEKTATGWAGDWFTSRALDAQLIVDTVPARGGIAVAWSADQKTGTVTSSLETPLSEIYVCSGTAFYHAEGLSPGVARPLKPVTGEAAKSGWIKAINGCGDQFRAQAYAQWQQSGHFYAVVGQPGALMKPTLKSIRWQDDAAVITGPVTTTP